MPIRVNCPHCGKQFSAWENLIGQTVQCPKCQQTTVLGGDNPALEQPPPDSAAKSPAPRQTKAPPAASGPSTGSRQPASPPVGTSSPGVPARGQPSSSTPAPPRSSPAKPAATTAGKPQPAAPTSRPDTAPRPTVSPDLDGDDSLPLACPHCHARMEPNDDLCDRCGYHLILKKVIDISDMKKLDQSTGFERVFRGQLHDAESAGSTLLLIKIVALFALLGILFMCLGRWWWIGALAAGGLIAFYYFRQRQAGEMTANQDPVSRLIWNALLSLQRTMGWRHLRWPFPKARALTLHDPNFDDRELADLEGLDELEAIDLEGCGITDAGLETLRAQKQLRFIVLRRTGVSPGSIARLQRDLPGTMIW